MEKTEGGRKKEIQSVYLLSVIENSLFSNVDYWDIGKGFKFAFAKYVMRSFFLYMKGGLNKCLEFFFKKTIKG